jgi:2-haloacid dehalogenase
MSIALLSFDVFGTVIDWRRGLREALGGALADSDFDRIVDQQGELERGPFRPYAEIVAQSLVDVLGLDRAKAASIGARAGDWPLFPDSAEALRNLRRIAPCAATTNSDVAHGEQVRAQLGFPLDGWICAEVVRAYKPDPEVWRTASRRMRVAPGRAWWHVSAYADYDLETARALGLTCVLVKRPHHRPGPADLVVDDLSGLAAAVRAARGPVMERE